MKNCPNCNNEVEDNFDLCWNCNYDFTEKRIIEINEDNNEIVSNIDCTRCNVKLIYSGQYKFHEGTRTGVLGNILELFQNRVYFDIFVCPECGKAEFYVPIKNK
ncbi:DNA-directed RNA polymerase subunit RPC12/RpoP [Dysgonomonas hofstadii]|uniref:DNA-directed RNA polymerase subunit RPC12/RpoP n=1 Tax=Dysgonomonas hofstadii TaxID=637886 RepID=A0A840CVC6_9BACT|nr:hypothetical protein [Dysgonomonas hofstadii]MBB4036775.1 DNA-directed RNA polymerase subunit RPC12/RpoP [Dysgonomonas hofstadii]